MPDFLKLQFTENPKSDSKTQRDSIRPDILIQYVITKALITSSTFKKSYIKWKENLELTNEK